MGLEPGWRNSVMVLASLAEMPENECRRLAVSAPAAVRWRITTAPGAFDLIVDLSPTEPSTDAGAIGGVLAPCRGVCCSPVPGCFVFCCDVFAITVEPVVWAGRRAWSGCAFLGRAVAAETLVTFGDGRRSSGISSLDANGNSRVNRYLHFLRFFS